MHHQADKILSLLEHARRDHDRAAQESEPRDTCMIARRAAEQYLVVLYLLHGAEPPTPKKSRGPTLGAFCADQTADADGRPILTPALRLHVAFLRDAGNAASHARTTLTGDPIPESPDLVLDHLDAVASAVEEEAAPLLLPEPVPSQGGPSVWLLAGAALLLALGGFALTRASLSAGTPEPAEGAMAHAQLSAQLNQPAPTSAGALAPGASSDAAASGDTDTDAATGPDSDAGADAPGDVRAGAEPANQTTATRPRGGALAPRSAQPGAGGPPAEDPAAVSHVDRLVGRVRGDRKIAPSGAEQLSCDELAWVRTWLFARHGLFIEEEAMRKRLLDSGHYEPSVSAWKDVVDAWSDNDKHNHGVLNEALKAGGCDCFQPLMRRKPCPG